MDGGQRLIGWVGPDPARVDAAAVRLGHDRLEAEGTSTTAEWVLTYRLRTGASWVTRALEVTVDAGDARRELWLGRDDGGRWSTHRVETDPGGDRTTTAADLPVLDGALDCDLGLCPLTNTMPVLREGLIGAAHAGEQRPTTLRMAWVSVPDLAISVSEQRYAASAPVVGGGAIIRFASDGFVSHVEVDRDGLVVNYPSIGRRIVP